MSNLKLNNCPVCHQTPRVGQQSALTYGVKCEQCGILIDREVPTWVRASRRGNWQLRLYFEVWQVWQALTDPAFDRAAYTYEPGPPALLIIRDSWLDNIPRHSTYAEFMGRNAEALTMSPGEVEMLPEVVRLRKAGKLIFRNRSDGSTADQVVRIDVVHCGECLSRNVRLDGGEIVCHDCGHKQAR